MSQQRSLQKKWLQFFDVEQVLGVRQGHLYRERGFHMIIGGFETDEVAYPNAAMMFCDSHSFELFPEALYVGIATDDK
jgi:hypothetical protein